MIRASDAEASTTSDSVIAPTAALITFTFTPSTSIFSNALFTASTLPATSAFSKTLISFCPSFILLNKSSKLTPCRFVSSSFARSALSLSTFFVTFSVS